ncbi:MAG: alpha/beta fold hydrolase [Bacteroidota bacterium]
MPKSYVLWAFIWLTFSNYSNAQELDRRPLLGIMYDVSEVQLIKDLPIGVEVKKVVPMSSAAKVGLKEGDVVVRYGNAEIHQNSDFKKQMRTHTTGDVIELTLIRGGKVLTKKMTLTEFPREENEAFETLYDQVVVKDGIIRSVITKPNTGLAEYPMVYIIQGIGCGSIENSFKQETGMYSLVESLTKKGFATFRMERSGAGDSQGTPCNSIGFNRDLSNFTQGFKKLQTYDYVNQNKVFIVGISMGGIMAPIIAKNTNVAGIVVYGTGGKDWYSYELENTLRQAFLEGVSPSAMGALMKKEQRRLHYFFIEKKSPDEIRRIDPEMGAQCENYPQHYSYFQEVSDVNSYDVWSECSTKVLAIHGHSDFVSSGSEHELIAFMVNQKHPNRATYKEFPNADHWMNRTASEKDSFLHNWEGINKDLIDYMADWIIKQL